MNVDNLREWLEMVAESVDSGGPLRTELVGVVERYPELSTTDYAISMILLAAFFAKKSGQNPTADDFALLCRAVFYGMTEL